MKFVILFAAIAMVQCRPQNWEHDEAVSQNADTVTIIPFYGGGKGQSLVITKTEDGKVTTSIIKTPTSGTTTTEESTSPAEVENPPLPSKNEIVKARNMKEEEEEAVVVEKEEEEAEGQLEHESREGLSAWFARKKQNKVEKVAEKKKKTSTKEEVDEDKKKKEEEDKRKKEEENKNKEEENKEEETVDADDTVAINLPSEDSSIAEAKPVGLAIAGEGGVAASKPVAQAVVGPGGLAVARPIATAFAGVPPDQVPNLGKKGSHEKNNYLSKILSRYHQE